MSPKLVLPIVMLGLGLSSMPAVDASQPVSLLQKAQRAVAGDVKVTALRMEGTRTRPAGAPPASIQLLWQFPNHYRQMNESESMMSYYGFVRETPVNGGKALQAGTTYDPGQAGPSFVPTQRAHAAQLLLGILGDTKGVLAVRATPGNSGAIRVTGPNAFECLLDVDPATGSPVRLRYRGVFGFRPAATPGQAAPRPDPPEPAEMTISFLDRRTVAGVRVPHHITRVARSLAGNREHVMEDLKFDRVIVNSPMNDADFEKVD